MHFGKAVWKRTALTVCVCLIMGSALAGCNKPAQEEELVLQVPTATVQPTEEAPKELSVTDLLKAVVTLKDDLETALEDMKEDELDSAKEKISGLSEKTQTIRSSMDVTMANLGDSVPALQAQLVNIQSLLDLLDSATETVLEPAIEQLEKHPFSEMRSGDGISTSLICDYLDFAESLMPDIERLVQQADGVDFSLVDDEGKMEEYLATANELLEAYREDPAVFSAMKSVFGADEDRVYLIAAQNSSEIRASGGFPGAMGVIRIEDGALVIEDFRSVYNVLASYTPAKANVTSVEHNLFHGGLTAPRDACYCPDFERVASIFAMGYEARQDRNVDGVISLTPCLVQDVLVALDEEIKLFDGTVLNGENATRVLQYDLYFDYFGNEYVQNGGVIADQLFADAAKKTLQTVMENLEFGNFTDYLSIMKEGIEERSLMLWMKDEQEQAIIRKLGWNGGLNSDPEKPQAGVYYNCTVASKMGWFLIMDTEMGERIKNEDGSYTYPITVTFSNDMTQDEIRAASSYITGGKGGSIVGSAYFFAPAGGTVSDFNADNNVRIEMKTYNDLQLGYMPSFYIQPNKPVTITYNVTTAPGAEAQLEFSKTPTVQEYH